MLVTVSLILSFFCLANAGFNRSKSAPSAAQNAAYAAALAKSLNVPQAKSSLGDVGKASNSRPVFMFMSPPAQAPVVSQPFQPAAQNVLLTNQPQQPQVVLPPGNSLEQNVALLVSRIKELQAQQQIDEKVKQLATAAVAAAAQQALPYQQHQVQQLPQIVMPSPAPAIRHQQPPTDQTIALLKSRMQELQAIQQQQQLAEEKLKQQQLVEERVKRLAKEAVVKAAAPVNLPKPTFTAEQEKVIAEIVSKAIKSTIPSPPIPAVASVASSPAASSQVGNKAMVDDVVKKVMAQVKADAATTLVNQKPAIVSPVAPNENPTIFFQRIL